MVAWAWLQQLVLVLAVLCMAAVRGETPAERCAALQAIPPASVVEFGVVFPNSDIRLRYNSASLRWRTNTADDTDYYWFLINSNINVDFTGKTVDFEDGPVRDALLFLQPVLESGNTYRFDLAFSSPTETLYHLPNPIPSAGLGLTMLTDRIIGNTFSVDGVDLTMQTCLDTDTDCPWYTWCPCTAAKLEGRSCVDFNECNIDHGCPANSECQNLDPGYSCACVAGFHAQGSDPISSAVALDGTCAVDGLTLVATDTSKPTSLSFQVTTALPSGVTFELALEQSLSASTSAVVSSFTSRRFSGESLTSGFTIINLSPGLEHRLSVFQVDGGVVQADALGFVSGAATSCSCDEGDEPTGAPGALTITQLDGFVTFVFTDRSMCEEAFSFKRLTPGGGSNSEVAFTADHYHHSAFTCSESGAAVHPGTQAADNLALSKLAVGTEYMYCVEAVRAGFAPSDRTCKPHTVAWEASVSGHVTLKKSAGLLPVEGVTAHWRLLSSLVGGTVIAEGTSTPTEPSGQFSVAFNINDQDLTNDIDYPLEIYFTKTTDSGASTIEHTFLCEDETEDCSGLDDSTGKVHVVYLRHMDFKVPVDVADDTSVPVSGLVTITDTGCALYDASVCLATVSTRGVEGGGACTQTDATGYYELPAVIGTRTRIIVDFEDHDIASTRADYNASAGIAITADGVFKNYDFSDTTLADLRVQVVGGRCDAFLGDSLVTVTIQDCTVWSGDQLGLTKVASRTVRVPAHRVVVALDKVAVPTGDISGSNRFEITEQLNQPVFVDLTDVAANSSAAITNSEPAFDDSSSNETAEATEAAEESEEDLAQNVARFQFDGTMRFEARFSGDGWNGCTNFNGQPLPTPDSDTMQYSFHSLEAPRDVNVTVFAVLDLGYGTTCDNLTPGTTLTVTNLLGILPSVDLEARRFLQEANDDEGLALLERCNEGCELEVQYEQRPVTGEKYRAQVKLSTATLTPAAKDDFDTTAALAEFTKSFTVFAPGGSSGLEAHVVVTGQADLGKIFSAALPTHNPLMVLRDPPGGGSYATYQNMVSHVVLDMEHLERFVGFSTDIGAHHGIVANADLCIGGLLVSVCKNTLGLKAEFGIDAHGDGSFLAELIDNQYSGAYSVTWSLTTSTDKWMAGAPSDLFLVPNLNVVFGKMAESTFSSNGGTCTAEAVTKDSFNLGAKENQPTLAVIPADAISRSEIPELANVRDRAAVIKAGLLAGGALATDDAVKEQQEKIDAAEDGLRGWNATLVEYEATNQLARDGALPTPEQWYALLDRGDATADDPSLLRLEDDEPREGGASFSALLPELLPKPVFSALLPEALHRDADKRLRDDSEVPTSDLKTVNTIKFYGGGAQYAFSLKHDFTSSHQYKTGSPKDNFVGSFKLEGNGFVNTDIFGLAARINGAVAIETHHSKTQRRQRTRGSSSSVGFVLTDADVGDVFAVGVFLDPKYGTFVFNTTSGKTKCPHEDNTLPRQKSELAITRPTQPVLPGADMIFEVELKNVGVDPGTFELIMDLRKNVGHLGTGLSGTTAAFAQIHRNVQPQESVVTTLSVSRGPVDFIYPAMELEMRPNCESIYLEDATNVQYAKNHAATGDKALIYNNVVDQTIDFAQPCPAVTIVGELATFGTFTINAASADVLGVTVLNPEHSLHSFAAFISSGRMDAVKLQYRAKGTAVWFDGTDVNVDPLPFVVRETDYGYATVDWRVATLQDGAYEVRVVTTCSPLGVLPAEYFLHESQRLAGAVDRALPRAFGAPEPASGVLYPGQFVSVHFDEPVNCASPFVFDLDARVDGVDSALLAFSSLQTLCTENVVRFTYDASDANLMAGLLGKELRFTLSGVEDLHGNVAPTIDHSLSFASLDLDLAATEFIVEIEAVCDVASLPALEVQLLGDLAAMINTVDASRIVITELRCSTAGTSVIASVTILPVGASSNSNSTGTRRRNLQGAEDQALEAYTALAGTPGLQLLGGAANVKGFQLIVSDDDKAQAQVTTSTLVLPDERAVEQVEALGEMLEAKLAASEADVHGLQGEIHGLEGEIRVVLAIVLTLTVGGFIAATAMVVHRFRRPSSRQSQEGQGSFGPKLDRVSSGNPTYIREDAADAFSADDILDIEAVEADEV